MTDKVSLVIPGRNAKKTLRACLDAAVPLLETQPLDEIIFVDDGSTDDTAAIVEEEYPVVRIVSGPAGGPGAARNRGWRAAKNAIIWFIDSDCVADPKALEHLLPHFDDSTVGGVGGSYANMVPDNLLACLIHEEIIGRHRTMSTEVDFLGSFNVAYRRSVLEEVGGFDEQWVNGPGKPGAEDADLAYRVHRKGHVLHFEPKSLVGHFHPTRMGGYLRSQRVHGYWRVALHLRTPKTGAGDAYSSIIDHAQPPLAMLTIAALPTLAFPLTRLVVPVLLLLLVLMQLPITFRLMAQTRQLRYLAFVWMGFLRAFWRGVGLTHGVLKALKTKPAPVD